MFIKVSTESETQDERIGGVSLCCNNYSAESDAHPSLSYENPLGGRAYYRTVGTKGVTRCHDTTNGELHNFDQPPTQTLSLSLSNTHTQHSPTHSFCLSASLSHSSVRLTYCHCLSFGLSLPLPLSLSISVFVSFTLSLTLTHSLILTLSLSTKAGTCCVLGEARTDAWECVEASR